MKETNYHPTQLIYGLVDGFRKEVRQQWLESLIHNGTMASLMKAWRTNQNLEPEERLNQSVKDTLSNKGGVLLGRLLEMKQSKLD